MKLTVITATYNSGKTISDTLQSIKEQSYKDVEHLVIDGKSTDNTLQIVENFSHVSKIIKGPDAGIYDAMNKGIKQATGTVIGILNSDDIYVDEDVLFDIMTLFTDNQTDVVYADLVYVDKNNLDKIVRTWRAGKFSKNKFKWGWMPPHPTFFVRKKIYDQYGLFNLLLHSAADYELMLRFMYKYGVKVNYLPRIIVKMRTGGQSNASLKNRIEANREDHLAWSINNIKPFFFTTWLKPIRKIKQFIT